MIYGSYNHKMQDLIDEIIYSNRKTMSIEVKPGGRVIMRVPTGIRKSAINRFALEKSDWIRQAKAKMANAFSDNTKQAYHDGASIFYLGRRWRLNHASKVKNGLDFKAERGFYLQQDRLDQAEKLLIKFYRNETRRLVNEKIDIYAEIWGLNASSVRITSAKSRWGSCNARNGLNFSYRLALLPKEMVEYIVVHELAHTRHHNHGRGFWELVGMMLPDYQTRRLWLKQNARTLPDI